MEDLDMEIFWKLIRTYFPEEMSRTWMEKIASSITPATEVEDDPIYNVYKPLVHWRLGTNDPEDIIALSLNSNKNNNNNNNNNNIDREKLILYLREPTKEEEEEIPGRRKRRLLLPIGGNEEDNNASGGQMKK